MGQTDRELVDLIRQAVVEARNLPPSAWDREVAEAAIRRWRSFDRRHPKGGDHEARVMDLARGLLERFDPDRMDEPGWHRFTAEAVAEVLRDRLP